MSADVSEQATASFEANGASVIAARRFVADVLRRWGLDDVLDDAVLLVSELVTNAVVHAGTVTDVCCALTRDGVQIDVVDRYPGRWLPAVSLALDSEAEGGRGLAMAATLASSWGVAHTAGTKRVWFALRRPAGTAARSVARPDTLDPALVEAVRAPLELDELLRRLVDRARDLAQAEVGFGFLLSEDGEEMRLRASAGMPSSVPQAVPAGRVARRPVVIPDVVRTPPTTPVAQAVTAGTGLRSVITVPMLVEGRLIGVLGVGSSSPEHLGSVEAARLAAAAERVALAVQTARVVELERERRAWVAFLAEASDLLGATLRHDMIVATLGDLVVPRLAAWCSVDLDPHDFPGAVAWVRGADTETPAAGGDPGDRVAIPLLARGRTLGTLTLGPARGARLRREVLDLAEDLARRAALALDNARLYADREATAQALQASLLPPAVPELGFVDVGVAYVAAGGHDVGGDFYDVFATSDGACRFAVGDVCGKGPEAAAVTGLARQALRLLGRERMPVSEVLERLNGAILDEGPRARFLTVVAGEMWPHRALGLDGDGVRIRLVCAGHPLPMVVGPRGVRQTGTPQLLLGVVDDVTFTAETLDLAPGEALVLVTDGVTERRMPGGGMLGESGLRGLLEGVAHLPAAALAAHLEHRVMADGADGPRDDLAVLVLKASPREDAPSR